MIKFVKKFLIFSLAVGFFSLVISLLGGEFIVRHVDSQPTFEQVKRLVGLESSEKTKRLETAWPQVEIKNRLADEGIGVIDLLPELTDKAGEQYFFGRDGHFNVRGHGRVAEAIFRYFTRNIQPAGFKVSDQHTNSLIDSGVLRF